MYVGAIFKYFALILCIDTKHEKGKISERNHIGSNKKC